MMKSLLPDGEESLSSSSGGDSMASFFAESEEKSIEAVGEEDEVLEVRELAKKESYQVESWRRIVIIMVRSIMKRSE
jgi:hypothetical protein